MTPSLDFAIRRAGRADADAIAAAHLDSIRSIGPSFYLPDVVSDWGARVEASLYLDAMDRGEVFFIAVGALDGLQDAARAAGAASIEIDASLAALEFYKSNGFEETGRGSHRLSSGRSMACVFMRKTLTTRA